jgi:hypothetical protein
MILWDTEEKRKAAAGAAAQRIADGRSVILDDAQIAQLAQLVETLGEAHLREALAFGTPIEDLLLTEEK